MEEEYPEDGAADCKSSELVNLTSKVDKNGKLEWDAPDEVAALLRRHLEGRS
jgi:hypothetical protein